MAQQLILPLTGTLAPRPARVLRPSRTIVFDTYWRFAAERQRMFFARLAGRPMPWTTDPVLSTYRFTNTYRASDRVSQHLIRHVQYGGPQRADEIFFRTVLYKLFNKIETWQLLERELGPIRWSSYDRREYDRVLTAALVRREPIYSAAYIMPAGSGLVAADKKHRSHLLLIELMMSSGAWSRVARARSMGEVFALLRSYPTIGDFLAYQLTIDLNYSTLTNFGESEFVVAGPGALEGIQKCFRDLGGATPADVIRHMTEIQQDEFDRLGIDFDTLWGRPLQYIDCQNLFCEVAKYARVAHPEVRTSRSRLRIKQLFRPRPHEVDVWYPPKWGLSSTGLRRVDVHDTSSA